MKVHARYRQGFRWEGVSLDRYKDEDGFRGVTRQVLFADEHSAGELRYFEIAPGGWTTLERHEHTHQVMILRGSGRALVGGDIFDFSPYDLVRVPPLTWHQFRALEGGPFGFLCLVDRRRDRPQRPTESDLAALRADPDVAAFLEGGRTGEP